MALPKRKHSHSRSAKRNTHNKLEMPSLGRCEQCKKLKISHRICPYCGYYGGKEVVKIELKEKKAGK